MGLTSEVYFLDYFNGSGGLGAHTPDIGTSWSNIGSGSLSISGGEIEAPAATRQYRMTGLSVGDPLRIEAVARFTSPSLASPSDTAVFAWGPYQLSAGNYQYLARWIIRKPPEQSTIIINIPTDTGSPPNIVSLSASITTQPGIHEIRVVGEGTTVTIYFDGQGLRITGLPDMGHSYAQVGLLVGEGVTVQEAWGKGGVEPDYELLFDTDFGPVGGPAGSGGGGGGSGGSASGGGSNPSNVPCDPINTLVINNGEVVAVAPTNPCQWTGLIWWKLVCEATLTANDYAVEAEVFFNTLTDPFMSVGVIARLNESTGGHYWATLWNDEIAIGKRPSEGADDIMLGFKLLTLQAGRWYKIRLEVEGFTLRAYLDDVLQVTAVDLNESFGDAGCAGIRLSRSNPATDIRFDNFRVWLNVIRPSFAEIPVFLESISVLKDDGMTTDYSIGLADSFNASEALTLLTPKTVHINEGIVFDDLPKQVKKIQDFVTSLDAMDPIGVHIALADVFTGKETPQLNMDIPISEVFTFTDEDRAIHGITETTTIGDFLSGLLKQSGALDLARTADSVRITRTSTAAFVKPEQTYEARALKTMLSVDDGKRVN